eukprot:scaffold123826_cov79-Cyclotella_meneghiniana.AAC.1
MKIPKISSPFNSKKKVVEGAATTSEEEEPTTQSSSSAPNDEPTALPTLDLGKYDFNNENDDDSNNYAYPPLFQEADDMVKLSVLIYTLIELREVARSGKLDENSKSMQILDVPLPMDKALSIIATEAELLKEVLSDGAHEEALSALQALAGSHPAFLEKEDGAAKGEDENKESAICGLMDAFNICWPAASNSEKEEGAATADDDEYTISTLTAIGDEKSNDELVYAVGINPNAKRITVAFRGSTTKTDFLTDAKIDMVSVPDPKVFATKPNEKSKGDKVESDICIHEGFYNYLFGSEKNGESKYDEIMSHVQKLYDSKPEYKNEYKLYVTGHSLGGALATLFGFYASASTIVPSPVTVVSVASPRVGNLQFAACFTEYESRGKLRHLRIANHRDPVTLGPTVSSKRMLTMGAMVFSPLGYLALKLSGKTAGAEEAYYHCGMKMKLRQEAAEEGEKKCELTYSGAMFLPKENESTDDTVETDEEVAGKKSASTTSLKTSDMPLVSHHFGKAYTERMASVEGDLEGVSLNDLYKTKTGNRDTV